MREVTFARDPVRIACGSDLDARLDEAPTGQAVFAIHAAEGEPYLGRTGVLRRRLKRLLTSRQGTSRLLNLRTIAERIEYWPVASRLQSDLILYEMAKRYLLRDYIGFLKLRMPHYVRLTLGTPWPRTQVTSRLSGPGQYLGPFRSRGAAEAFERDLLDLFQVRRCQEDLVPAPDHPGCIYGEMSMCLRPCQAAVSEPEYASEVARLSDLLATRGRNALQTAEAARDRLSAEMEFEAAAQQHKRAERIEALMKLRDDLASDIDSLSGLAVLPSTNPGSVLLWRHSGGFWMAPQLFDVAGDHQESMDARLRPLIEAAVPQPLSPRDRAEHLAILARWFYSSWRDGVWIDLEARHRPPYRRIVSAISRTVHESAPAASH